MPYRGNACNGDRRVDRVGRSGATRALLGTFGFAIGLGFLCCQTVVAAPTYPTAIEEIAAAVSATQKAIYTYRRTKHGWERCYHRNRFGTRSWRRLFSRIPDC
jgi:hypothetical protein